MKSNLLATKLHRPSPSPKRVHRPHLVTRLNEGLAVGRPLSLVSAPAGFGKTSCISEWLNELDLPAAWLSLDPADDDPQRFFAYFVAALQKIDEAIGREIEGVIHTGQIPPGEAISTALINDIVEFQGRFILVLDDFHVIRESAILKALEVLLNNQPGNMHLILISREDPLLPLARLRANNRLTEIRAADLRFSRQEADHFLNGLMELSLPEADIAALENRTEGWVVGLQLAAIALRSQREHSDPSNFIASLSGSQRYILSYLTEEVLSRQPEAVQHFLLQTSILERLCGELCDAVVETRESRVECSQSGIPTLDSRLSILNYLERANLFLIPLDDEGHWYRYHHLFADLLRTHLYQAFPAGEIKILHMRAAAWFGINGLVVEAVDHALKAEDFEGAARWIEQNAEPMLTRGELNLLLRWTESLPDELVLRHPLIIIAKAWALTMAGAVRQVEPLLQQVEAHIEGDCETPTSRELRGHIAAIRAFFAMLAGDYPRALDQAESAENLLPETSVQPRSMLPYTIGSAYRGQGEDEKAVEAFTRVAGMGENYQDLIVYATGMTEVVNTLRMQGRLHEACEVGQQALQRIQEKGAYPYGSLAKIEVAVCEVLREQNKLEEAQRRVTEVMERMQAWAMPTDRIFADLALIRILEAKGDFTGASDALRIAKELKSSSPVLISLAHAVDLLEIRLCLAAGEVSAAARFINAMRPGENRHTVLREQELAMLARVRLAQGQPDEAIRILDPLVHNPGTAGRLSIFLEILTLQSIALNASVSKDLAVTILIQALTLAEPERFVRVFVGEGEAVRLLIEDCRLLIENRKLEIGEVMRSRLLSYIDYLLLTYIPSSQPAIKNQQSKIERTEFAHNLIEPLTDRELEVLRLMADGLKYEEIAARLFISLNTVRTYVKGIYGKLNVNNRTKAIVTAQEHKLI